MLFDVRRHAFVGAVVDDPSRWAVRFAELCGTEVLFDTGSADAGFPVAGVSLADNVLALYALPPAGNADLWGIEIPRPRTHVLGLQVADLSDAAERLTEAGFRVVRSDPTAVVIDPSTTGGIGVVLVQDLLPNDPRLPSKT